MIIRFKDSYVWATGLRNSQGLDFSPSGILYSSEHGPQSDDEINILEVGRNYGWPDVKGMCDDQIGNSFLH
jgi:aldose sugar dehydrogenase